MLRCSEIGLHDDDLKTMTVGMVYDLLIEKNNDQYDYPTKATQDDIYKLFGR